MGKLDEPSAIGNWIMKRSGGRIKNEKQANLVLIGIAGFAIIVAVFLLLSSREGDAELVAPPGNKVIYPTDGPPRLEKPVL